MKQFVILALAVLALSPAARADDALADTMTQIGNLFTAIQSQIGNPADNSQSADDAAQLVSLFTQAQGMMPPSIAAMPSDQQGTAVQTYQSLLQTEINDATSLQAAFQQNDNADASTILQQMNSTRLDGHSQFATP
jgi:hypothetical protein